MGSVEVGLRASHGSWYAYCICLIPRFDPLSYVVDAAAAVAVCGAAGDVERAWGVNRPADVEPGTEI
jgi:hypothetical protein